MSNVSGVVAPPSEWNQQDRTRCATTGQCSFSAVLLDHLLEPVDLPPNAAQALEVAALTSWSTPGAARTIPYHGATHEQQEDRMHTAEHATAMEIQQCIDECLNCCEVCVRTTEHWFELRGKHVEASQVRTVSDCVAICQTNAGFMLRGSRFHAGTCALCAEVCRECERECRRIGDDQMMQQCADACRRCAESCERIANVAA
jgi:hypothetical protein